MSIPFPGGPVSTVSRRWTAGLRSCMLTLALFLVVTSTFGSRITERPFSKPVGATDLRYSAELKKNKDGSVTVNVNFKNPGTETVVILFCFMIETTKGRGVRTSDVFVLVKDGEKLKCVKDTEENFPGTDHTQATDHHTSHLGCRPVEIKGRGSTSESFTTDGPFDSGGEPFTDQDFELSYADVALLRQGEDQKIRFDKESCKDVAGNNHFLKILEGETARFVTEWAIRDVAFKDPFVRLGILEPFYVRYADWPCIPVRFPLPFAPYPQCPSRAGPPPPTTVPTNLFDAHTMAKGRTEDSLVLTRITRSGDRIDAEIVTEPAEGVVFAVAPDELPQGTLTAFAGPSVAEGDSLFVTVTIHDVETGEDLFSNGCLYVEDTEPPVVAKLKTRLRPNGRFKVKARVRDATSDPDKARLWASSDNGETWVFSDLEGARAFTEIDRRQTYKGATPRLEASAGLFYFIEAHDTLGNVLFTDPVFVPPLR